MEWKTVLASITGTVDQELLLRNEYLVAENRILRNQITGRVRLRDGERTTLAALGKRLGKKVLAQVMSVVKPETLLAWHRKLIARKFDGSTYRRYLRKGSVLVFILFNFLGERKHSRGKHSLEHMARSTMSSIKPSCLPPLKTAEWRN